MVQRFRDSVILATGKGGVGKTTTVANLASYAAGRGEEVVMVDLDPQANLATEFGIEDHDGGKSMLGAAMGFGELELMPTGRERLSYVASGDDTNRLFELAFLEGRGDPTKAAEMIRSALETAIAPEERVRVFFDTPPSAGASLADAALMLGEWLVIPTKTDRNSLNGVSAMLHRLLQRSPDPEDRIRVAGVVLFDVNPRATSMNAETRAELEEDLNGAFPVLSTMIRHADKAQADSKNGGVVSSEYAALKESATPWYESVKTGEPSLSFAGNAEALAADYESLARELHCVIKGARV